MTKNVLQKIKINCYFDTQCGKYRYVIINKKTRNIIMKGYYKRPNRFNKSTGDIAKEIYFIYKKFLNDEGYIL